MTTLTDVLKVLDEMGEEPLAQFMRSNGTPPEEWVLLLPSKLLEGRGRPLPEYCRAHPFLDRPVAIRKDALFPR